MKMTTITKVKMRITKTRSDLGFDIELLNVQHHFDHVVEVVFFYWTMDLNG